MIFCNISFGQSIKLPNNVQSPTSASLGKYGDVPVSLYSGTPNINIPITEMEALGVKLDVSLSYDASGVRVSDMGGWVGQNWSLNAGGVITRSINRYPDEINKPADETYQTKGYFYPESYSRLAQSNWTAWNVLEQIYLSNYGVGAGSTNGIALESQPDIFTFNFMGMTGKFFMGEDGQWKVASDNNLKVKILEADFIYPLGEQFITTGTLRQPKVIGKIEITDDAGITYTFGGNTTSVEYTKNFFAQNRAWWDASAWYLTKVSNSNNKTLFTLDYIRDIKYAASFYTYQSKNTFSGVFYMSGGTLNCSPPSTGSGTTGGGTLAIGGSLISAVYLSTITSLNQQKLTFTSTNNPYYVNYESDAFNIHDVSEYCFNLYTNNAQQVPANAYYYLGTVVGTASMRAMIKNLSCKTLTKIAGSNLDVEFHYNDGYYDGYHDDRIKLNDITFSNIKKYAFEYDRFDQLPKLLSTAYDHLGYYKGTPYASVGLANADTHYNQRLTDADKVKIGTLTKIIYPTKGYTMFEYESHKYSQYVADDKQSLISLTDIIGGVRIKKITNNDGSGNLNVKEYKYVKDYNLNHATTVGTGILSNKPKYHWPNWKIQHPYSGAYFIQSHFSTNPIIPLGNFFGSPIEYSEVVEINGDQSYTIYKYTSNLDFKDEVYYTTLNPDPSPYEKYNDRSLLRGKLKEVKHYNSSDLLVSKTVNTYSVNDPSITKYVRGTNIDGCACPNSEGNGAYFGNTYLIYYFDNSLISEHKYTYTTTGFVETDEIVNNVFEYYPSSNAFGDVLLQSTNKLTYLDIGGTNTEYVEKKYFYPYEMPSTVNTDLMTKRIIQPLQTQVLKNNEVLSTNKVEYAYVPTYGQSGSPTLGPYKYYSSKAAGVLEEKTIIDYYDSHGNVFLFHNNFGISTNLVYAYYGKSLVAKIEGLSSNINLAQSESCRNQITTSLGANFVNWSTNHAAILSSLQALRNNNTSNLISTYTYKPFNNIYTATDPKGYMTYFYYDTLFRLVSIKDAATNTLEEYKYNYKP